MNVKQIIIITVFISVFFNIFAIDEIPVLSTPEERSWRLLEKAELAYDTTKYEDAMLLVIKAKENRINEVNWAIYTLEEALKPMSVQKIGDSISDVLKILKERNSINAIVLLEQILLTHSKEYFNNSIKEIQNYIKTFYSYPEAEYLTGKLYFIEGEYSIAKNYYLNTWKNSAVLTIPEIVYEVLYDLANLAKIEKNDDDLQKYLLLIIEKDDNDNETNQMIRSLNNSKIPDQFFNLFRTDKYFSLNAYFQLADFYYLNNEIDKALNMSINGVIGSFSRIDSILKERNTDYKYTTISNTFMNITKHSDIIDWASQCEIWKVFFRFAQIERIKKNYAMADSILNSLYSWCPDSYWNKMAFNELKKMNF